MNIMITGASSGIGLRTAEKLVAQGHTVVNVSRTPCDDARIVNVLVDLSEPDAAERAFDGAKRVGTIDAGIYCAGFATAGAITDIDADSLEELTAVNYTSAAKFTAEFLRRTKAGTIVLVSSVAAFLPLPYQACYSAAKAALLAYARAASLELRGTDYRLHCVVPAGVATQFSAHRRKIYGENENANLNAAVDAATEAEQTGQLADDVAQIILDLLDKPNSKTVKYTGSKSAATAFGLRFLPLAAQDGMIYRKTGQKPENAAGTIVPAQKPKKPKIINLKDTAKAAPQKPSAKRQSQPHASG